MIKEGGGGAGLALLATRCNAKAESVSSDLYTVLLQL